VLADEIWLVATAIVERHSLQRRALQHFNIMRVFVRNRQQRIGGPCASLLDVLRIIAEVAGNVLPCRVERLPERP